MSASLVGSEMCIRDRGGPVPVELRGRKLLQSNAPPPRRKAQHLPGLKACLLYTSDAADDM
eukprot:15066918-Alexandrium_andersonii.AAC.1